MSDDDPAAARAALVFRALGAVPLAEHVTAVARHCRWSAALPFKLLGVEAILGSGRAVTHAALDLAFRDTRAPLEVVSELLRAREKIETKVTSEKRYSLLSERIGRQGANFPVAGWVHRVVGRVLVDVQRAYPIESATLRAVRDDEFYIPDGG